MTCTARQPELYQRKGIGERFGGSFRPPPSLEVLRDSSALWKEQGDPVVSIHPVYSVSGVVRAFLHSIFFIWGRPVLGGCTEGAAGGLRDGGRGGRLMRRQGRGLHNANHPRMQNQSGSCSWGEQRESGDNIHIPPTNQSTTIPLTSFFKYISFAKRVVT